MREWAPNYGAYVLHNILKDEILLALYCALLQDYLSRRLKITQRGAITTPFRPLQLGPFWNGPTPLLRFLAGRNN